MIQKLKSTASHEEVIKKINELIDKINDIKGSAYIGEAPSAYDLNAVGKYLKRGKR